MNKKIIVDVLGYLVILPTFFVVFRLLEGRIGWPLALLSAILLMSPLLILWHHFHAKYDE
jgi:hypothetical protein